MHPQESENAMADFQTRNYRKVRKKRLNLQLFQYVRQAKEGSGESFNLVILSSLIVKDPNCFKRGRFVLGRKE